MSDETFEGWVILELMGHRRLAGYLREQQIGGVSFLRLDTPAVGSDLPVTQFYGAASVYCITPCTEETARACAGIGRDAPVQRWELPLPRSEEDEG